LGKGLATGVLALVINLALSLRRNAATVSTLAMAQDRILPDTK
jgi:hypothetical protein